MNVVVDTSVLGFLCHTNPRHSEAAERRFEELRARAGTPVRVFLPEIADYELRRKLVHIGSLGSIAQLDRLVAAFVICRSRPT